MLSKVNLIKRLLHNRKLSATTARLELLQLIQTYQGATPFSLIQSKLDIDRITLYRTIVTLIDKGLIHKILSDGEIFYAMCGEECSSQEHHHNHVHFKCNRCNVVSCEQLAQNIEIALPKFKIDTISINAEGICKNCYSL